ncbi:hypothetical protein [Endozoicomonas elysicola]|uniref:Uncharacterized protein n=1 Tax=Endozoicomonas elysicola TaxID=305900 RepID=A0A081KGL3_9GAMM|nr:hypothetical protein [Endozoicomonas elysicola]KEI73289.1 hypothetical protein GV64_23510 [Endozoicomonas elysicola]
MSEQINGLSSGIVFQKPNPADIIPKEDGQGRPIHPYSHEPMSPEEFKRYMHRLEMQAQSDENLRKALMGTDEAGRMRKERQVSDEVANVGSSGEVERAQSLSSAVKNNILTGGA